MDKNTTKEELLRKKKKKRTSLCRNENTKKKIGLVCPDLSDNRSFNLFNSDRPLIVETYQKSNILDLIMHFTSIFFHGQCQKKAQSILTKSSDLQLVLLP